MQGEVSEPTSPSGRFVHENSGRILRATSSTFTGGAAILPPTQTSTPATETTPLRQDNAPNTIRATRQEMINQRLMSEFFSFVSTFKVWTAIAVLLIILLVVLVGVIFFQALYATIYYRDKPCDQPLKYYMIVALLWCQVPSILRSFIFHYYDAGPTARFLCSLILSLPGWIILGSGAYMIGTSKTCHETNPELFFPLRGFIQCQIGLSVFALVVTIFGVIKMRTILQAFNKIVEAPGCLDTVRQLPHVSKDSPELKDDDGQFIDCSICMDEIVNEDNEIILRVPCGHCFHEDCLLEWCKNHLDCPLCRQQIGPPDKQVEPENQA